MFYLPIGSVPGKAGRVIPVLSPLSLSDTEHSGPSMVSVALVAFPCHYKGISLDANGLFVGRSRALRGFRHPK